MLPPKGYYSPRMQNPERKEKQGSADSPGEMAPAALQGSPLRRTGEELGQVKMRATELICCLAG